VGFGPSAVTVDARAYGPKDGLCCPSIEKTRVFRWSGGAFTEQ
jgi:hypothetical protein